MLREAEAGAKTADLARWHGVSKATLYSWTAKYGGMEVSEAKRLLALEDENGRLKRLLAGAMLDNSGLTRRAAQPTICCQKNGNAWLAKREAVAHLQALLDVSERRACRVIAADRTVIRYQSCRGDDEVLREKLRALAHQRRRFGYRRLHILLRRDGIAINRKKTQRLYREEGLTVRRRKGRKRAVGSRAPVPVPALPNQRWSLDVVHDQWPVAAGSG